MSTKSTHIPVINGLRGFAALSVCLYHFVYSPANFVENEGIRAAFDFGQMGVQVFFIISGIVIPLSMLKINYSFGMVFKFLWKRVVRIEPPYLVAVLLGIGYLVARNYVPSSNGEDLTPTMRDIFLHLAYLVPFVEDAKWINSVFWTLAVEFQYYLFLALTFPLVLSKQVLMRIGFYILVIAPPIFFDSHKFFPYWSAFFALGIAYALLKMEKVKFIEFAVLIAVCSGMIFYRQGPIELGVGLGTLLVIHFFENARSKATDVLGNISYSLYLIHNILGAMFVNFMSHRVDSSLGVFLVIVGGVAISIGSAWLFWWIIEKPSQRLSQKVKLRKDS